jgi:hypothetical protein
MKPILLISICVTIAYAQLSYAPLTKKQREAFIETSQAIVIAANERNYEGIQRFAPSILKEYQAILLDPKSKDLREAYRKIESLYAGLQKSLTTDSLESVVTKSFETQDYLECLTAYQDFYPQIVKTNDTALILLHRSNIETCMKELFAQKPTYETYQAMSQFKYINRKYLDSLKSSIEQRDSQVLLNLSGCSNIDTLLAFKRTYPVLYESDVDNLIESLRAKWRLRIRRKPAIEDIEHYLRYFPQADDLIDSLFEKVLYVEFKDKKSQTAAMKYLNNFPDGRYRIEIQDYFRLYEQQTMRDSSLAVIDTTTQTR